jgi:hypothetical protein
LTILGLGRCGGAAVVAAVSGSVGTVGDAYDNALAESVTGLFQDRAD